MGQLAEEVHKREAGKLPSYPALNPKHKPGGPKHVNMVTSLRNGKTYNNDIKIPSVHDFSHDVKDFVTNDEIVVEGKKADNVKFDSELGGVSSTTTLYLTALEKSASISVEIVEGEGVQHQVSDRFGIPLVESVEDPTNPQEILQENLTRSVHPQVASPLTCLQSPL
ncbi:hypothetical protein Tco_1508890 [Tanacetum coccineum]